MKCHACVHDNRVDARFCESCGAVLAARGIQQAMLGASDRLTLRIGLKPGPVVAGRIGDNLRTDYTAVGDTTNLAARLQQHAEPDRVRSDLPQLPV